MRGNLRVDNTRQTMKRTEIRTIHSCWHHRQSNQRFVLHDGMFRRYHGYDRSQSSAFYYLLWHLCSDEGKDRMVLEIIPAKYRTYNWLRATYENMMFMVWRNFYLSVEKAWFSVKLNSKTVLIFPTVSTSTFHSTNLFLFSRHHIPTNSVAPFSAYKHAHNPHFLQSLWRRANARKRQRLNSLRWPIYVINSADNTRLPALVLRTYPTLSTNQIQYRDSANRIFTRFRQFTLIYLIHLDHMIILIPLIGRSDFFDFTSHNRIGILITCSKNRPVCGRTLILVLSLGNNCGPNPNPNSPAVLACFAIIANILLASALTPSWPLESQHRTKVLRWSLLQMILLAASAVTQKKMSRSVSTKIVLMLTAFAEEIPDGKFF